MKKFQLKNHITNRPEITITMADKVFIKAQEDLKVAEKGCKCRTFDNVDFVMDCVMRLVQSKKVPANGSFLVVIKSSNDDYAKSCKYDMYCTQANVHMAGRKVTSIEFKRSFTGDDYVCSDSVDTSVKLMMDVIERHMYLSDVDYSGIKDKLMEVVSNHHNVFKF